jgi:hypothetical protein
MELEAMDQLVLLVLLVGLLALLIGEWDAK